MYILEHTLKNAFSTIWVMVLSISSITRDTLHLLFWQSSFEWLTGILWLIYTRKIALLSHLHPLHSQFMAVILLLSPWVHDLALGTTCYSPVPITPVLKVIQLFLYDILMLPSIDCCSQLCVISRFHQHIATLCAKVTNKNITYNWPQDLSLRNYTSYFLLATLFSFQQSPC